jgi:HAD superfamily phosphatase (TIGR01681 family)
MIVSKNLKLVVFDIDYTIHNVKDKYMPKHVLDILQFFRHNNIPIAIASLNQYAQYVLKCYKIYHLFSSVEYRQKINECHTNEQINEYNSLSKTQMFHRLSKKFKINYEEMLFFDDNVLNIIDAKEIGIKAVYVNPNKLITWTNVHDGLALFDKRKRRYSH